MKKVLLALALMGFIAIPAIGFSANQQNTGCGLGSLIMQGNDGLLFQVLAVTTNGTFGNQTFGISSGTLNCKQPGKFATREKINSYIADNMDNLARDVAAGQGEYLDSLAELMSIPAADRPGFNLALHQNYTQIFANAADHADVLDNIAKVYPVS